MNKIKVPSERSEQQALVKWARLHRLPLVSIPNEGKRSPSNGANLALAGLSSGFPDLLLPKARGGYFGLILELKQNRKYRPSEMKTKTWLNQIEWIKYLNDEGFCAQFAFGWEQGMKVIEKYMSLMPTLSHVVNF
jgi:hypothetical protein